MYGLSPYFFDIYRKLTRFFSMFRVEECNSKNRSLRGHVLTGNECYTINIVYVIVDMLLSRALTMNACYVLEPNRMKTRWQVL